MKATQNRWFWLLAYCLSLLLLYGYFQSQIDELKRQLLFSAGRNSAIRRRPTLVGDGRTVEYGANDDDDAVIIYNRVPKTGSTSFTNAAAYDLCKANGFHVIHVNVTKNRPVLTWADQGRLVRNISDWTDRRPAFFHGHIAFLDFTRFGRPNPIYINLVREPLERLVSHYYFLRYGDNFRVGLKRSRNGNNETFDECVERGGRDCDPKQMWLQVPFFCGSAALCWEPGSEWALEQAKRNLVDHYLLVGLTENIEDFIAVLEVALPRFFHGALKHFLSLDDNRSHMRNTKKKIAPMAATVARMKASAVYQQEAAFYAFAKRQFEFALERSAATKDDSGLPVMAEQEFHYEKIRPFQKAS